jgi:hypothetical protein
MRDSIESQMLDAISDVEGAVWSGLDALRESIDANTKATLELVRTLELMNNPIVTIGAPTALGEGCPAVASPVALDGSRSRDFPAENGRTEPK